MTTRRIDAPPMPGTSLEDAFRPRRADARVKRIREADPTFDPTGKSDAYLDARIACLDTVKS